MQIKFARYIYLLTKFGFCSLGCFFLSLKKMINFPYRYVNISSKEANTAWAQDMSVRQTVGIENMDKSNKKVTNERCECLPNIIFSMFFSVVIREYFLDCYILFICTCHRNMLYTYIWHSTCIIHITQCSFPNVQSLSKSCQHCHFL